jgi:hypothetical protein
MDFVLLEAAAILPLKDGMLNRFHRFRQFMRSKMKKVSIWLKRIAVLQMGNKIKFSN